MLPAQTFRKPPKWALVAAGVLVVLVALVSLLESGIPDARALDPAPATEAASSAPEPASAIPSLVPTWRLVISMAVVIGIAVGAAFVVKRFSPLGRTLAGGKKRIEVVEVHALGGKRFLCLVRLDAQEMLLGLSPARIDLITETPNVVDASEDSRSSFAELASRGQSREARS
ncbi:MAG: FliO/MopB family protein [Planctomycetes bacterium]|nr:FliO/MopB family protein [Planctomycetota bacterium]MBI3843059.1 FliO/MopB family protein [Planctomycetota bacterium]